MSASDDIKDALVAQYPGTSKSKWKRVSKKKVQIGGHPAEIRVFEHPADPEFAAPKVVVCDDDVHGSVDVGQGFEFGIELVSEEHSMDGETFIVSFGPTASWSDRSGVVDSHLTWLLEGYFGIPADVLQEPTENTFISTDEGIYPRDVVASMLTRAGMNGGKDSETSAEAATIGFENPDLTDDDPGEPEVIEAAKAALTAHTKIADWIYHPFSDETIHAFRSPSTGQRGVVVLEDPEDTPLIMHTGDPMYFYMEEGEDEFGEDDDATCIMMMTCPKSYWNKHKAITDWQVMHLILELYDVENDDLLVDEVCENQSIISGVTLEEARAAFEKAGMIFHEPLKRAGQGG